MKHAKGNCIKVNISCLLEMAFPYFTKTLSLIPRTNNFTQMQLLPHGYYRGNWSEFESLYLLVAICATQAIYHCHTSHSLGAQMDKKVHFDPPQSKMARWCRGWPPQCCAFLYRLCCPSSIQYSQEELLNIGKIHWSNLFSTFHQARKFF